jgi:hypothetical protein
MKIVKYCFCLLTLIQLVSCVPSSPYDVRSPCVSNPTSNPYQLNPCIKKPMWIKRDIV